MDGVDFDGLSKKERKRFKKELERQGQEQEQKKGKIGKWMALGLVVLIIGFGITALAREFSKPLPGQNVADQGRIHVSQNEWEKFSYNSNPPTSGPHDAIWTKAGIYDTPQGDGHLIHALEHGYIVISYNCDKRVQGLWLGIQEVFAHETEEMHEEPMASASAEQTSSSAELKDDIWGNEDCKTLKKQLADLADKNKLWKLIVVPRPNLDVPIALTTWGRIAKLDKFSEEKISRFIDAFRNHGPEATAN